METVRSRNQVQDVDRYGKIKGVCTQNKGFSHTNLEWKFANLLISVPRECTIPGHKLFSSQHSLDSSTHHAPAKPLRYKFFAPRELLLWFQAGHMLTPILLYTSKTISSVALQLDMHGHKIQEVFPIPCVCQHQNIKSSVVMWLQYAIISEVTCSTPILLYSPIISSVAIPPARLLAKQR